MKYGKCLLFAKQVCDVYLSALQACELSLLNFYRTAMFFNF